jgi:MoxR-like ATPase
MASKFNTVYEELVKACKAELNVLLSGPHGIGKTAMVLAVVKDLNLTLKTFSASTLDPFADLVGIPATYMDHGVQKIQFLRPEEINQAEVLFFDELNRAHPRTLNAILEIIQFRKINGTPLPNLKLVIAAINAGNDHYQVVDLDPALLDRFHVQIDFSPDLEQDYLVSKFGADLGQALFDWYQSDLSDQQRTQVSPRRLEYIGQVIRKDIRLEYAMPLNTPLPVHLLKARLEGNAIDVEDFVADPAG